MEKPVVVVRAHDKKDTCINIEILPRGGYRVSVNRDDHKPTRILEEKS